jgi:SLT domain-containing protein
MTGLDRGTLARIDRKLLAALNQDERYRMVRVPVTAAKWSTWKRYCDTAGVSMGRAIMALIERELMRVTGESTREEVLLPAGRAEEQLAAREAQVGARERDITAAEEHLRRQNERLRLWQGELEAREQRIESASKLSPRPSMASPKVGRNEQCPCGSGLKYKRCHGE